MATISPQQARDLVLKRIDPEYAVAILRRMVGADSENPPGNEMNMARCIQDIMAGLGIDVRLVEVEPGRPSVVTVIRGTTGSPALILNGHIDTVPIGNRDDWSVDPFGGELRAGRLFGRGAADMKGGVASIITAVKAIRDAGVQLKGNIILQFAMGEETGEPGTKLLLDQGFVGEYGIVTEPTGLRVATAARGLAWFKLSVHGRPTHAGTPQLGVNAIELMAGVIDAVTKYHASLQAREHPLVGSPTCTVTMITGGIKENVVPDRCEIIVDRRMMPGEQLEKVQAEVDGALSNLRRDHPDARYDVELLRYYEAAEIDVDAEIARVVRKNVGDILGLASPPWGALYGTDTRNLVNDGHLPAVTFGPGFIEDAHGIDESVEVKQVVDAARVIASTALDLLGVA